MVFFYLNTLISNLDCLLIIKVLLENLNIKPSSALNRHEMHSIFFGNWKENCYLMLFIFQPNMFIGVKCAGLTRKNIFPIMYVIGLSTLACRRHSYTLVSIFIAHKCIYYYKMLETENKIILVSIFNFAYMFCLFSTFTFKHTCNPNYHDIPG